MAGLTSERLTPSQDMTFPTLQPYRLGLTNLAHRPTARSEQLTRMELERGVPELLMKIARYRPRVICFVGKQIADVFMRVVRASHTSGIVRVPKPLGVLGFWHKSEHREHSDKDRSDGNGDYMYIPKVDVGYGVLPICMPHEQTTINTLFFVTPSTSARVTQHQLPGKVRIMSYIPKLLEYGSSNLSDEFRHHVDMLRLCAPAAS